MTTPAYEEAGILLQFLRLGTEMNVQSTRCGVGATERSRISTVESVSHPEMVERQDGRPGSPQRISSACRSSG